MRENENLRTLSVRGLLTVALWAAFAPCAFGVSICYEGRYLDAYGNIKANVQVPATIRAYASEDATAVLASAETTIATDGDGRFAALAEELNVTNTYTTFWIGVTPQGGAEIKPRMRVSPAPFAIVAANVERVESASAVTLGGDLTATKVGDQGVVNADATADNVMLTGDITLRGSVNGAKDIYIRNLYLNNGNVSFMRANAPNGVSTQWSQFNADYSLAATGTTGIFGSGSQTKTDSFTAEDDGIVMVMIRVDISLENDPDYWVKATLSNGDFKILDDTLIGVTGEMGARLFTFPVRKGQKVSIKLHNYRYYTWRDVESWAKAKVVYFGAR
jgi:hypothetical protein